MKSGSALHNRWATSGWGRFMKRSRFVGESAPKNRRRYVRYECSIPVEVHIDSPGQLSILKAEAHNISSGGMLIKCPSLPESQAPCHVSFLVPEWFPLTHADRDAMAAGQVKHTDRKRSTFGVAFIRPL